MKIENYVRSLLPSFEKVKIKEDLRNLQEVIDGKTLTPYKSASDFFNKDYKFQSRQMQEFQDMSQRSVKHRAKNVILLSKSALEQSNKNLSVIIDLVDEHYSNDVVKDGLTYLKVNLLQYIESLNFMSAYARRLLLMAYALEANPKLTIDKGMSRDLRWLEKNFSNYLVCVKAALLSERDFKKKLDDIPELIVEEESVGTVRATAGADKVDPMGFGFISVKMNPIYHLRSLWSRFQIHRLRLAQDEMEQMEFRLAHLRNKREGKADPKLEETIERYEIRIEKARYELEEMLDG